MLNCLFLGHNDLLIPDANSSMLDLYSQASLASELVHSVNMNITDRMAALLTARGVKPRSIKPELAKACGISYEAVRQWFAGETGNIKNEHLIAISRRYKTTVDWLLTGIGEMDWNSASEPAAGFETRVPSNDDYASIPQYTAKGSAGNGHLNDHVEVKGGLAFKKDWLSRLGVNENRCSVIYAQGSSMEPSIFDDEVVLINHDETAPRDGKVYLIRRPDGEIIIKRLVRTMNGWLIRSDNDDKRRYPDEPIDSTELQQVEVIGRVVWRGGGM